VGDKHLKKTRKPRGLVAQLAALLLLAQALHTHAAAVPPGTPVEIDVASGPLANALLEIGRRYGVILSFQPQLVEGMQAAPLRGRYPLDEALRHALRDSDLTAAISPQGVVTLKRVAVAQATAAPPSRREPPAAAEAAASVPEPDPEPGHIPPQRVVIEARADRSPPGPEEGFLASRGSTAAMGDASPSEIPQAVSVVTRDMLIAAQARTQLDALEYAAGVNSFSHAWGFELSAMTRGFPVQFLLMGLPSYCSALALDAALIERVETVKGPSGVIGGIAGAGGRGAVVNFIRKEPVPGQKAEVTLDVDSWDGGTVRSTVDVGGGSESVLWRLVSYGLRTGRTDAGYEPMHSAGLMGSARYRGEDLTLTLSLLRERRRSVLPRQLEIRAHGEADAPYEMQIAGEWPVVSRADGRSLRVLEKAVDARWRLSDDWSLHAQARQEQTTSDAVMSGYVAEHDIAGMDRYVNQVDGKAWRLGLHRSLSTGPVEHRLMLAGDMQSFRSGWKIASAVWQLQPETFVPGQTPLPPEPTYGSFELQESLPSRKTERGLLVQDQLRLGDLSVRLALRRARFLDDEGFDLRHSLSGRNWDAGAAYRLTSALTVYAGAQSALEASASAGDTLAYHQLVVTPARSRQQQVGAKADLLDGRMAFSLEAYRLRQLNVLHSRSDGSGDIVSFFTTGLAANGVEMELTGRASGALDLSVGMNAMRTRQLQSVQSSPQSFWTGTPASPQRSMHLLASYRLPPGLASGLSANLAMRAHSASWGAARNPETKGLRIPGGARLDLALMRRTGPWLFGASVQNVFDRQLCEPTNYMAQVRLQQRRSFGFTLGYTN
jgi:iron complex outermembrane receptor protein